MKDKYLYEEISQQIAELIHNGTYTPGEKLTSVRELSKEKKVSLSTAFKAYEELIFKGFIETRPRSGYYVSGVKLPLPKQTSTKTTHKLTSTQDILEFAFRKFTQEDIVRLSVTSPGLELLPTAKLNKSMNEALRKSPDSCVQYGHIEGNPELRKKIAIHTFGWGGYCNYDEVVITHGCIEAIVISLMTVTKPGDTVIIEKPTYFSIYNIIKNLGLNIVEIDRCPQNGIDFIQLEKAVKLDKVSACILIPNFGNPISHLISEEDKQRIVDTLAKYEIPLIEDDIYGEIYYGPSRPITCKQLDKKGLVMLCSSFSKTLAPGYRVGWCLPGKFKKQFLDIKLVHTVSSAAPTQAALAQFFNSGRYDLHMKNLRKQLQIQCSQYSSAIATYFPEGTKSTNPDGGFVLWIQLPDGIDAVDLFQRAMNLKISIWPGPIFSASGGFNNFIRISFGLPFNNKVEQSLKVLGSLCRQLAD